MSWLKWFRFLFAKPGTTEYELGYAVGRLLRGILRGDGPEPARPSGAESPEEAFRKLADDNKEVFGDRDRPKTD